MHFKGTVVQDIDLQGAYCMERHSRLLFLLSKGGTGCPKFRAWRSEPEKTFFQLHIKLLSSNAKNLRASMSTQSNLINSNLGLLHIQAK